MLQCKTWLPLLLTVALTAGLSQAVSVNRASGMDADSTAAAVKTRLDRGIALHNRARDGEAGAAEKAVNTLKPILDTVPQHATALVYIGSAYAIMSRDAHSVVNKVRYVNRGIGYLEQAKSFGPDDFVVRLVRANVNASLPEMFKRSEAAREDMLKLDALFQAEPTPARAVQMTGIYKRLAKMAAANGRPEAVERWRAKQVQASALAAQD
ncbi:hypothetical protein NKDENANG_03615 [Candidatus Entotheonellaceae bacterium PAL068K]